MLSGLSIASVDAVAGAFVVACTLSGCEARPHAWNGSTGTVIERSVCPPPPPPPVLGAAACVARLVSLGSDENSNTPFEAACLE